MGRRQMVWGPQDLKNTEVSSLSVFPVSHMFHTGHNLQAGTANRHKKQMNNPPPPKPRKVCFHSQWISQFLLLDGLITENLLGNICLTPVKHQQKSSLFPAVLVGTNRKLILDPSFIPRQRCSDSLARIKSVRLSGELIFRLPLSRSIGTVILLPRLLWPD